MSPGLIRALFITDPLIILATIILGSINLAVSFFDDGGRKQVGIARFWSKVIIRIAGVKLRIEGLSASIHVHLQPNRSPASRPAYCWTVFLRRLYNDRT